MCEVICVCYRQCECFIQGEFTSGFLGNLSFCTEGFSWKSIILHRTIEAILNCNVANAKFCILV